VADAFAACQPPKRVSRPLGDADRFRATGRRAMFAGRRATFAVRGRNATKLPERTMPTGPPTANRAMPDERMAICDLACR